MNPSTILSSIVVVGSKSPCLANLSVSHSQAYWYPSGFLIAIRLYIHYEKCPLTCHAERSEASGVTVGWEGCQGAGQLRPYQPRTSRAPALLVGAQLACALAQRTPERVCHGMLFPGLAQVAEAIMILDVVYPVCWPRLQAVSGTGKGAGEAGDGVGVAGGDGGAADGGYRVIGKEEEAKHAGGEGFLGYPACPGRQAGVALAVSDLKRGIEPVEDVQALLPAASNELLGMVDARSLPEGAEPVFAVDELLALRIVTQAIGKRGRFVPGSQIGDGVSGQIGCR